MDETCEECCEVPAPAPRGPRYEVGKDFDAAEIRQHLGREPTLLVFLRHFG